MRYKMMCSFVAISALLLGCAFQINPSKTAAPTSIPILAATSTAQPTPSAIPIIAVQPTGTSLSELRVYADAQTRFTFGYPANWKIVNQAANSVEFGSPTEQFIAQYADAPSASLSNDQVLNAIEQIMLQQAAKQNGTARKTGYTLLTDGSHKGLTYEGELTIKAKTWGFSFTWLKTSKNRSLTFLYQDFSSLLADRQRALVSMIIASEQD